MIETHDTEPLPSEQVRAYLDSLPRKPPIWERDVADVRLDMRREALASSGEPEQVATVEPAQAGGVPARLYRPAGGERDVFVWMHGGAWLGGDLDSYDAVLRALANRAGCAVLSVDYRLAPEHRYPAAVEDCWSATTWALERFDRVAVGGDSAGGNLAAAVALRARDGGMQLALQLLVYPVLDHWVDSPFYQDFTKRYAHFAGVDGVGADDQAGMRYIWQVYVPDSMRRSERDASPLRAASFVDVAPTLLITAEHDILRGESEAYAQRLAADEVPVELVNYEGQIHGFFEMLGVMDDSRHAVALAASALKRAFRTESSGDVGK